MRSGRGGTPEVIVMAVGRTIACIAGALPLHFDDSNSTLAVAVGRAVVLFVVISRSCRRKLTRLHMLTPTTRKQMIHDA